MKSAKTPTTFAALLALALAIKNEIGKGIAYMQEVRMCNFLLVDWSLAGIWLSGLVAMLLAIWAAISARNGFVRTALRNALGIESIKNEKTQQPSHIAVDAPEPGNLASAQSTATYKQHKQNTPEINLTPIPSMPEEPVELDMTDMELTQPIPQIAQPRNYFSRNELVCKGKDCGCEFPGMEKKIMQIANEARAELGPLLVNSAYRCPVHNSAVGGVKDSKHVLAMALDIVSPTLTPLELYNYFNEKYPKSMGIGLYNNFVHIDSRIQPARWNNTTGAMVP